MAMADPVATAIAQVTKAIIRGGYERATKYVFEDVTVKAKKKAYKHYRPKRLLIEIALTIGQPNFAERLFIKKAIKAGEPFPIKKLQLKAWTPKKKKR